VLALIGAVNIPIIKFSVDWWSTLHQGQSIFRYEGPSIDPNFLWPLFIMALAYTFLFLFLWLIRIRTEVLERRVRAAMMGNA
jgi:heme exporter protein C